MSNNRPPSSVGKNGEEPGTKVRLLSHDEAYTWLSVGMELEVAYVHSSGLVYVNLPDGTTQHLSELTETWEVIS